MEHEACCLPRWTAFANCWTLRFKLPTAFPPLTPRIIHRDLKPDNILVTCDGRVKILDFGLAKSVGTRAAGDATQTMRITDPGTAIGTINYMSPEQARGDANLTPQSDQFSLGLILYELAARKRAFQRPSAPETMTAIIREDAEPLPASVPAPLRWVIERLLAKEPADRYDSTRDLYRELKQARERFSETSTGAAPALAPSSPAKKRSLLFPALVTVAGVLVAWGLTYILLRPLTSGPDLSAYKFTPISLDDPEERSPEWAPNGKSIAYTARIHGMMQVFTRAVGSAEAVQLTKGNQNCAAPFWSPDGATIYFLGGRDLYSVPAAGGAPQKVMQRVDSASLHPDGETLAFERDSKIWIGSLKGSEGGILPGPSNGAVAFSRNGAMLAIDAIGGIWIAPFPSGTPHEIKFTGIPLRGQSWFPDNRHLIAVTGAQGNAQRTHCYRCPDGTRRVIEASPYGDSFLGFAGRKADRLFHGSVRVGPARGHHSQGRDQNAIVRWNFVTAKLGSVGNSFSVFHADRPECGRGRPARFGGRILPHAGSRERSARRGVVARWVAILLLHRGGRGFKAAACQCLRRRRLTAGYHEHRRLAWNVLVAGRTMDFLLAPIVRKTDFVKIRTTPERRRKLCRMRNCGHGLLRRPAGRRAGDWIAYPAVDGIDLISPDGRNGRKLTSLKFSAYSFTKDGRRLLGVFQNTSGEALNGSAAQWQLYSVNVDTGKEEFLAPIDLPASVDRMAGFSIHPDGTRFLTSVAKYPFDLWMLEGFDTVK